MKKVNAVRLLGERRNTAQDFESASTDSAVDSPDARPRRARPAARPLLTTAIPASAVGTPPALRATNPP